MADIHDLKSIVNQNMSGIDLSDTAKCELRQKAVKVRRSNRMKFALVPAMAVILICTLLFTDVLTLPGMVSASENLMRGVSAENPQVKTNLDSDFIAATADFSVRLFQSSVTDGQNSLISPLSVGLALGMTANGARNNTLKQIQSLLGGGKLSLGQLNSNYYSLMQQMQSIQHGSTKIANSIWYRKDLSLKVERSFLQDNAAYYNAGAFQLDFKSQDTVNKMNNWVKRNTNGRIDKILDKIQPNDMMYLINALSFECGWDTPYKSSHIIGSRFDTKSGTGSAKLMVGTAAYLHDSTAKGFVKNFQDPRFGFMAILPNDIHVSLSDYISSMTGEKYLVFLKSKNDICTAYLPMFKYDYSVNLKQQLIKLGLSDSFSDKCADFGRMGTYEGGNLYIGEVLHKTNIEVSPVGVKAGAATKEDLTASGFDGPPKEVILNRPFIYAIIDNSTGLPIFLGTMENPESNQ